jgi:hypothetical protein
MRRRIGITEAIIGFEVLAIIVCMVAPAVIAGSVNGQAQQAAREILQVADAATVAHGKLGQWPEDGTPGVIPASFKPFLPPNLTFDRDAYQLNWEHWRLSDGNGPYSETSEFAGVSVITNDPRLLSLITDRLGTQTHFTVGNRTIVMVTIPVEALQ